MEQPVRAKPHESDHTLVNPVGVGPGSPVLDIDSDLVVGKPVRQRRRHGVADTAVTLPIARGHDGPARGDPVVPKPPVQDQLVCRGGNAGHGGGQFVQKEEPRSTVTRLVGQHRRYSPFDMLPCPERDAPQVARLHLRKTDVHHGNPVAHTRLPDQVGLTDSGRPPEHHRRMLTAARTGKFMIQDKTDMGWSHVALSSESEAAGPAGPASIRSCGRNDYR